MIPTDLNDEGWYCVRSQPKHEHIAAANLRRLHGIEVFNPSLKVRRPRPTGPIWVREPLFPGYLFARFGLTLGLDRVRHTSGVKSVVHFGEGYPQISDTVITDIRSSFQGEDVLEHTEDYIAGDSVEIVEGALQGFKAVVCVYFPVNQRVKILLDFLGQSTLVEISSNSLRGTSRYPKQLVSR